MQVHGIIKNKTLNAEENFIVIFIFYILLRIYSNLYDDVTSYNNAVSAIVCRAEAGIPVAEFSR
jgi:hypothetical protein